MTRLWFLVLSLIVLLLDIINLLDITNLLNLVLQLRPTVHLVSSSVIERLLEV